MVPKPEINENIKSAIPNNHKVRVLLTGAKKMITIPMQAMAVVRRKDIRNKYGITLLYDWAWKAA